MTTSFRLKLTIFSLFLLSGCGTPRNNTFITPQQINEPIISLLPPSFEQQTERINNCDGASPNYLVSYKTVEAQSATFEVVVEAGGLVTGTPIPTALEVQLEAKIAASLSKQYGITIERNHELPLVIPTGKKIQHVITWKVTRIKGLIDVLYDNGTAQVAFNKIASIELYDRQSEELPCDESTISATEQPPFPEETESPSAARSHLVINDANYILPDSNSSPYCVAKEIHTGDGNRVSYAIEVPEGWVMAWNSYKAYWPGGQYETDGLLVITGPWQGTIEIDTGGSCSGPVEWADWIIKNRMDDYPVSSRPIYYVGQRP